MDARLGERPLNVHGGNARRLEHTPLVPAVVLEALAPDIACLAAANDPPPRVEVRLPEHSRPQGSPASLQPNAGNEWSSPRAMRKVASHGRNRFAR
jgi:hypothetical protein